MSEDQAKSIRENEPVNWQILTGAVLQVPAAVAGVGFFFGTAAILGKLMYFPGLARQLSVTDVISEAIVVTPPFLILWIFTSSALFLWRDRLPNESIFGKYYKPSFRIVLLLGPIGFVLGVMSGYPIILSSVMIISYIFLFLSSAILITITRNDRIPKTYLLLLPILCTFVLIFLAVGELARLARDYPDEQIRTEGYEICLERCYPGIVVTSTSTLAVVRFWGTKGISIVPNADIKSQTIPVKFIHLDSLFGWL